MARLETMQFLVENGIPAGVMMAPLLPGISDSDENIEAVAQAARAHGAQYLGANVLFLKPGSKEWFMPMLREAYPHLEQAYAKLYRKDYAPKEYTDGVLAAVERARLAWGLDDKRKVVKSKAPHGQLELAFSA